MASTVLPNGIIIPEKYSRDWYADLYHNWQELDNLLGGGTPKDGTLTIQKNGSTVGTFSANQATDETIDITVPTKTSDLTNDSNFVESSDLAAVATSGSYNDLSNKPTIPTVNNATLTIQRNGTTVDTFTANASVDKTININTADDTKIPLAGSNAISGDLVPTTDNSIDIGSSTKNIKMLYTKGITIDGKTVDTDANGNMTYDSHIVDTIEEQGNGYIRYSNGLQICWGTITWQSNCSRSWGSLYETSPIWRSYAKSFVNTPSVSVLSSIEANSGIVECSSVGTQTLTPTIYICRATPVNDVKSCVVSYIAIGRWK